MSERFESACATSSADAAASKVPRTALIVAVPEAEPLVREWRLRYDNASVGVPAHVTLLFPFIPAEQVDSALLTALEDLFAGQAPVSFSMPRVASFLDGRPFSIATLTVRNGSIVELDFFNDPDRLRLLDLTILDD
jgi:hypothetical protein